MNLCMHVFGLFFLVCFFHVWYVLLVCFLVMFFLVCFFGIFFFEGLVCFLCLFGFLSVFFGLFLVCFFSCLVFFFSMFFLCLLCFFVFVVSLVYVWWWVTEVEGLCRHHRKVPSILPLRSTHQGSWCQLNFRTSSVRLGASLKGGTTGSGM